MKVSFIFSKYYLQRASQKQQPIVGAETRHVLRRQAAIGAFRDARRQGRVHTVPGRIEGRADGACRLRAAVLRAVQGPQRM